MPVFSPTARASPDRLRDKQPARLSRHFGLRKISARKTRRGEWLRMAPDRVFRLRRRILGLRI